MYISCGEYSEGGAVFNNCSSQINVYVTKTIRPIGSSKTAKALVRRRAKGFQVVDSVLYHKEILKTE